MALTKIEQAMFPKVITERHYKKGADIRDFRNQMYAVETTVNNEAEQDRFYEMLNHEANTTLEYKLPNGVIK